LHDAIVIGAGPAGNMAAARLASGGLKVAVIDWRTSIGDKLCTGIIGRECALRFPPKPSQVYRAARSAVLISPSGRRHTISKEEPQAFIIDRVSYVSSLAENAASAGAEYRLGENVVGIEPHADCVDVLATAASGDRRYRARVLVIAAGFGSGLVRMAGLADRKQQSDYMIGVQAVVETDGLEDTEVYLGDAVAPGSFGWVAPMSDTRALVGIVSRRRLNGHMRDFMEDLRRTGRVRSVLKEPRRWGIPIRPISRTFRDRVVVVGDAAGLVKPTTGGGIYYALISGELAAETVLHAFEAGDFSARQMRAYETRWRAVFGKELRVGYVARRVYESLGDGRVERLVSELLSSRLYTDIASARDTSFDWHSGVIMKAVGHQDFRRVIGSIAPTVSGRPDGATARPL